MIGKGGNDIYIVDTPQDRVVEEAGGGIDTIRSSANEILSANVENLILTGRKNLKGYGNKQDNRLTGNLGNNYLDGKGGDDVIIAGKTIGDDTYVGGNGVDTVDYSSAVEFGITVDLSKGLAFSEETGSDTLNGIENIVASSKRDLLTGNSLANLLDGGRGKDIMIGKDGNDTYVVDTPQDRVVEEAGGGVDIIHSSVNQTLSANIENLTLVGRENLKGYGNGLNNQLIGNQGDNFLDGMAGRDSLTGNGGDDRFIYRSVRDAGANPATRDVITDFNVDGIDLIDLSRIDASRGKGDPRFVYIGKNEFSGRRGEVRFSPRARFGVISVNTGSDTDTRPDMQIELEGVTEFSPEFLIL